MKITSRTSLFVLGIALASPVFAQNAPTVDINPSDTAATQSQDAQVSADTEKLEIGEIVVTAQRRSENLQDVPISITAISGGDLAASGVNSAADLPLLAPSLSMAASGSYIQPRLRGVGTLGNGPGIENAVALYVDGVYIAQPIGGVSDFSNIRSVEVINGPQGTLFGRNATGGLIQIRTMDPSPDLGGNFAIGYANYDTVSASGYFTGGSEIVAADFAFDFSHQSDGYAKNIFTGTSIDYKRSLGLRSKIKFAPSDDLSFVLAANYQRSRYSPVFTSAPGTTPLGGAGPEIRDRRDMNGTYDPYGRLQAGGVSLTAEYDMGFATLQSISAYRSSKNEISFNGGLTPNSNVVSNLEISEEHNQYSQEFQLSSDNSGPLTWTAGAYFFSEKSKYDPVELYGPFYAPIRITINTKNHTKSQAVYGQGTYKITDTTRLTAGLRYSWEQRDADILWTLRAVGQSIPIIDGPVVGTVSGGGKLSTRALTARLSLDHDFSDDILGYASYNRGFKSGGFSPGNPNAPAYEPETINAYEVGIKSSLFDRRLRFNASAFYYDYSNIQVQDLNGGVLSIYNGAKARLYGLDLDADWLVSSRLKVHASLALLHSEYLDFDTAVLSTPIPGGGTAFGTFDAKGNELPVAPDLVGTVGLDYRIPSSVGEFKLNGTYTYNDGFFAEADERLRQKAYHMVNAQISWTSPDESYEVMLFGRNLANEDYAVLLYSQIQGDAIQYAPPRTYGVSVKFNF